MNEKYERIVGLPHKQSSTRKHMSLYDRAAQFAPFAALTGYESSIQEKSRLTTQRLEIDEYEIEQINYKLQIVAEHLGEMKVAITYFVPDAKKSGGAYITKTGTVKQIEEYTKTVIMTDKTTIPIEEIVNIEEVLL